MCEKELSLRPSSRVPDSVASKSALARAYSRMGARVRLWAAAWGAGRPVGPDVRGGLPPGRAASGWAGFLEILWQFVIVSRKL
jgi:hypothetical protein